MPTFPLITPSSDLIASLPGSRSQKIARNHGAQDMPTWRLPMPYPVRLPWINADDFYAREAFVALANFLQAPCKTDVVGCCMVGYKLRSTLSEHGTVGRGVCRCDADGFLEDIVEMQKIERDGSRAVFTADDGSQQSLTGDEIVSMNCWGFAPSVFDLLTNEFVRFMQNHGSRPGAEFHLPGAINTLIRKGKASVKVLSCDAQWCGVTYRDDKPFVQKRIADLVAEGAYPERLWS